MPTGPKPVDVFAILGFVFCFICPVGVVSGILSLIALRRIKKTGNRGRGLAIAGLVLSVLAIVGMAAGIFALVRVASRPSSFDAVRAGDCLATEPQGSAITDIPTVSCAGPHKVQVIAKFSLPSGEYPGESAVQQQAEEGCIARVSASVKPRLDEGELGLSYLYPQASSWSRDRGVVCLVSATSGQLTEVLPTS